MEKLYHAVVGHVRTLPDVHSQSFADCPIGLVTDVHVMGLCSYAVELLRKEVDISVKPLGGTVSPGSP